MTKMRMELNTIDRVNLIIVESHLDQGYKKKISLGASKACSSAR